MIIHFDTHDWFIDANENTGDLGGSSFISSVDHQITDFYLAIY